MVNNFVDDILHEIDNYNSLSVSELRTLVYGYSILNEDGDYGRWTMSVHTIVHLKDRYFAIDWERGLTENQDDEFWYQPVEVVPHTYEKTITVTEYIPLNSKENS